MNISDRPRLYANIHRVLVPGGRLALYDVIAGEAGPIRFPVPRAKKAEHSSLLDEASTRAVLEQTGFEVVSWRDETPDALMGFATRAVQAAKGEAPALGLQIVMGPNIGPAAANLREGRARVLQAVVRKPG